MRGPTDHPSSFTVGTVVLPYSSMCAAQKVRLPPFTPNVIQQNRQSLPFTKLSVCGCLQSVTEPQLPANHVSVFDRPQIVTNNAPVPVNVDFHSSTITASILVPNQPYRSILQLGHIVRSGVCLLAVDFPPWSSGWLGGWSARGRSHQGWCRFAKAIEELQEPVIGLRRFWLWLVSGWQLNTS